MGNRMKDEWFKALEGVENSLNQVDQALERRWTGVTLVLIGALLVWATIILDRVI